VKIVDELVLNEVEGKKILTIKIVYFRSYPQYSRTPFFHVDGINRLSLKDY
jgi:hypothetical protein